jgi:predicted amidohydrolase
MKIAASNWSLSEIKSEAEFWARLRAQASAAAAGGAAALVLPEYFALSLCALAGGNDFLAGLRAWAASSGPGALVQKCRELAQEFQLLLIAGSMPIHQSGQIYNRAYVLFPDGKEFFQDKVHMTRFEAEEWGVSGGAPELLVFDYQGERCAVLICYDVEFPVLSQALAQERVSVLFVPSCTDDVHGYWRVRHCAEARTVENQCFAAMASIVEGDLRFPNEIGTHYGEAVVLSPSDVGFPTGGILSVAMANQEAIAIGDCDFTLLAKIRRAGTVLNLRDTLQSKQIKIHKA